MPKLPNAGELRTRVFIEDRTLTPNGRGYDTEQWTPLFGGLPSWARWQGQRVNDVFEDGRAGIIERVHITMRRSTAVTATCRIRRSSAEAWWTIVGAPYETGAGAYIEFDAERRSAGI